MTKYSKRLANYRKWQEKKINKQEIIVFVMLQKNT